MDGSIPLWNFVKYKAPGSSSYENGDIYCLKAGIGFRVEDENGNKKGTYNVIYDMKKEREAIATQNTLLRSLVKSRITEGNKTYNRYDALLAVLDMLYMPGKSSKKEIVDTIFKCMTDTRDPNYADYAEYNRYAEYLEEPEYQITDNEISSVQQAVIWYFTNYYKEVETAEGVYNETTEHNMKYDKLNNTTWMYYTKDGTNYESLVNYTPNTPTNLAVVRNAQVEVLYRYMINTAKEKANEYTNSASIGGVPVRVDTTKLESKIEGENCVIGPIHLTQLNPTPYRIDFKVKNNNVELVNKQEVVVGEDFYVSVPKNQTDNLTVNISIAYDEKSINLLASTTNNQEQPLAKITKTSKTVPTTLKLEQKEEEKIFDLALRKYITEVNGERLKEESSRIPNIDESSLTTGETATYNHKKDPVTVEKNDVVTYEMTIYNEGEKAGRALEIVDQLPTGLEFQEIVSGNFNVKSYSKDTDNKLTLIRKEGNQDNLPAFTAGNLLNNGQGSETIVIKCKVTANAEAESRKVLTNVAWIEKEYDAETNQTITNQNGADRDSEPATKPDVNKDNMSEYKGHQDNKDNLASSNYYYKGQQDDDDFEKLILLPKTFDLALRKYITQINDEPALTGEKSRVPNINEESLKTGMTATYKHKKDPVIIKKGDKVTYKMTIYNEGDKPGRATKVIDQLPSGLEFKRIVSGNFEVESYNKETDNTLHLTRKNDNQQNLPAYVQGNLVNNGQGSETIEIECEVTAEPDKNKNKILTNVAWIAEAYDAEKNQTITNQQGADRDSEPATKPDVNKDNMENYKGNEENPNDLTNPNYFYKGQQDDDDFEKLIVLPESFDLKLIKRITAVNNQNVPERIEKVDVSKLNTLDENGNMITTGNYQLNKNPVTVKKGDIVTYTFRIYNEGTINGYAQEITEDVPEGLEFLWSEKEGEELKADTRLTAEEKAAIEFNQNYLWGNFQYDENKEKIIQISSDYLSQENETTVKGNLIEAFGKNDGTKTENDIHYKEIAVKFKVVSNELGTVIKNEAAITEDCDEEKNPVDDRDSHTDEWKEHPDHEDDEDHDYIILQSFDLALRKFIIAVSKDTKIEPSEYLKNQDGSYQRAPEVDTSKLNEIDEKGKLITTAIYNHTKQPVLVQPNDIVVYMLRVYNEGEMNGYAGQIKDHLPPYLEFVEGEFNEKYGWEIEQDGRTVTTRALANELIQKAQVNENGKVVLSYKEVPIMCKVKANAKTSENITNIADITEYLDENKKPVVDRDSQEDNLRLPEDNSLPHYKDKETGKYVPGQQDDDDFEKVIIKTFDLALRKWVTQAIVIEDGKEKITQTGHQPWDEPEAVVKVELNRKKINQVTVKFKYSIRVYNQGEIAGYAKEVTDYIPQGLKFVATDNPGWKDEGNHVISTKLLENTLLQPGEYADVEVLLTWINNENNMGVMNNIAEISQDDNEYDVPDIDSTPDNQKSGEDDIDDAPVMLSITTGQVRIYFMLGFIVLISVAGGVILIKKFVL